MTILQSLYLSNFTVDENQTAIGIVSVSDADNDTLTYSISGSEINIDSSTGVLTICFGSRL